MPLNSRGLELIYIRNRKEAPNGKLYHMLYFTAQCKHYKKTMHHQDCTLHLDLRGCSLTACSTHPWDSNSQAIHVNTWMHMAMSILSSCLFFSFLVRVPCAVGWLACEAGMHWLVQHGITACRLI